MYVKYGKKRMAQIKNQLPSSNLDSEAKKLFTKDDFKDFIIYEDLVHYLIQIITDIRQSQPPELIALNNAIQNIMQVSRLIHQTQISYKDKKGNTFNYIQYSLADVDYTDMKNLQELLQLYKLIQKVSIQLRKVLINKGLTNIKSYDDINYSIWYNDSRYLTDEIKADQIFFYKHEDGPAEIRINLEKVVNDLKQSAAYESQKVVQNILTNHYQKYYEAIKGMYEGDIDHNVKGQKVNRGHVAEAFERHLAEHHGLNYQALKATYDISTFDKMVLAQTDLIQKIPIMQKNQLWSSHEQPDPAWIHIRDSLGRQRGTAAGDVWNFQVKRGSSKSDYSHQVRLTSLKNIETGINRYLNIYGNKPVEWVATEIASYLTDSSNQALREIAAIESNKLVKPILKNNKIHLATM